MHIKPPPPRQRTLGLLLAAMGLGTVLYLAGLAATLPLGDARIQGVVLVPALPTSLYIIMALVVCAGVGVTLLASFVQRRRRPVELRQQRQPAPRLTPWQVLLNLLVTGTLCVLGIRWLMQHGTELLAWWQRWRLGFEAAPDLLAASTRSLLRQVDSPTAGYALFAVVLVVYGGLAVLGLWVLCADREPAVPVHPAADPQLRQVQRAVAAGLRALQQQTDPRQAIIACYARLEHLLEDYGVPAYGHLTPQEYMGAALQGIPLPAEAFAGLVSLFEQARYSLHSLDNTARTLAITYLDTIQNHLQEETTRATPAV